MNAFLDSYRYVFNDETIRPLTPADFYAVRFGRALLFRVESEELGGSKTISQGISFGDYPLQVKTARMVGDEEIAKFREFLKTDANPPLPATLLLNARGFISQGEYRLALIETGTALDIAVEEAALRVLISKGQSRPEALAVLEPKPTRKIAKEVLQPSLTWDLLGSSEWQDYDSRFRDLRNAAVHDAVEPGKPEAEKFVAVVSALTQKLA